MIARRHADDMHVSRFGELHDQQAHATAGAFDDHGVARLEPGENGHGAVSSDARRDHPGGLLEAQRPREHHDVSGRGPHLR
ncbi:hypothetical protein, partial [Lacticaseibacillus camelliae]|uniref:hypothetical protein n=1 Tax=Lacticaseibacillus camelliae TaxID=381742 RepID=UPI0012E0EEB8